MEHSYIGNNFVAAVESLLTPGGSWYCTPIVWTGDYADEGKFLDNKTPKSYIADHNDETYNYNLYDYATDHYKELTNVYDQRNEKLRYLINRSRQEFVDLEKVKPESDGMHIHPLPLLTCDGNGRGGGDYKPEKVQYLETLLRNRISKHIDSDDEQERKHLQMEIDELQDKIENVDSYIGRWAGDELYVYTKDPSNHNYTEIYPNFTEEKKEENKVLNVEQFGQGGHYKRVFFDDTQGKGIDYKQLTVKPMRLPAGVHSYDTSGIQKKANDIMNTNILKDNEIGVFILEMKEQTKTRYEEQATGRCKTDEPKHKGARKWVTTYAVYRDEYVKDMDGTQLYDENSQPITKAIEIDIADTKGEAVSLAKDYATANKVETYVRLEKRLDENSGQQLVGTYKPITKNVEIKEKEQANRYFFFGNITAINNAPDTVGV